MQEIMPFELSLEYKDQFQAAIDRKDATYILESLEDVNPADVTSLLYSFDADDCKYLFSLFSAEFNAQILEELETEIRKPFIKGFSSEELATYVEHMDSDDGADLLFELPVADRNAIIRYIHSEEKAANLMELLEYDEDVAGGLMAKEFIKVDKDWNVLQCIEEIRKQAENVEKIYSVYVTDKAENLLGKVSVKKIILSNDQTKVLDIYNDEIVSVETSTEEDEVASIMQKYDLEALPVVNARGKLVGRITIDDIVDVITENADEERQLMSGVSSDVEENDSVWRISRARLPWLIIGIAGGLIGANFLGMFEGNIKLVPALAFFIPLITATGGNVGIQASSIVVQTLANPNVLEDKIWKRLFKVLLVALLNGLILSILVFVVVLLFMSDQKLAITASVSLFSVVLLASMMGTITPLILDKFGINPALASGPFITTANDLLGLAVYFMIANILYQL